MYVVVNRITVDPARSASFADVFAASMSHLEGVPGLVRSTLLTPATDGLPFVSTMEFDSREDFTAWLRSESFRRSHDAVTGDEGVTGNEVELYELHTEVSGA